MTADAGVGVEILTVGPIFVGKTNVVADSKSYNAGGAVRERCPSVPHPRFECTEVEHELRYVFNLVKYFRFGLHDALPICYFTILNRVYNSTPQELGLGAFACMPCPWLCMFYRYGDFFVHV